MEMVDFDEESLWGWKVEGPQPERTSQPQEGCRCFLRGFLTPRSSTLILSAAPPRQAVPEGQAKAKAKPKAKPKPKPKAKAPPPPPRKTLKRPTSTPPAPWKGPKPSSGTKSERVVNWNPIRQSGLLEGSIWQQVNETIEQRSQHLIPQELLDKAFTRSEETQSRPPPRHRHKRSETRVLPPKEALMADLLHCQLAKQGLADLNCLRSAVGGLAADVQSTSSGSSYSSSSSSSCDSSDSESDSGTEDEMEEEKQESTPMDEEALQTLLTFLSLAEGIEEKLTKVSGESTTMPLAASERLLQQVLTRVGPASLVQSRVQAMLSAASFPKEADELEKTIRSGIKAAEAVANSKALPVFLEGVLVLGNYVNSASQALGLARGVTLDSIAKLAHTKALPDEMATNGNMQARQKSTNALCLVVRQLQKTQGPVWFSTLMFDLEGCRTACKLLCKADTSGVQKLAACVSAVEKCFISRGTVPTHHVQFMAYASARLATLRILEEDLSSATVSMRRYFAEPEKTPLSAMLRNLEAILEVLPHPEAAAGSAGH
mmetsp:Transcript_134007/g.244434  ORF Transcript_134007/g.244434 Transcript_134007/m.244434 type:complete len:545 (+) Transcript_134007:113-1747(+)